MSNDRAGIPGLETALAKKSGVPCACQGIVILAARSLHDLKSLDRHRRYVVDGLYPYFFRKQRNLLTGTFAKGILATPGIVPMSLVLAGISALYRPCKRRILHDLRRK